MLVRLSGRSTSPGSRRKSGQPQHSSADIAAEQHRRQRPARTDRRDHVKEHHRRDDHRQRYRDLHPEWQRGQPDNDRPYSDYKQWGPDDYLNSVGKEIEVPGFLLHVGATVLCSHAGQAQPTVVNPRVLVSGQPTVTMPGPYVVAGCALPPPLAANGPCITAQFITAATRITSNGQPLLLQDSQAICAPTGTPLMVVLTQLRVSGM